MRTVAFHTLGCKVNAYESEALETILVDNGYKIVDFDDIADVYVINTCSVTNIADRKSRQMIHQAAKRNEHAVIVAMGCYVQTKEEEAKKDESIDIIIGNNEKNQLPKLLDDFFKANKKSVCVDELRNPTNYEEMKLYSTNEHTRAFVKIQDGCNQFCTYCIIPYARGRIRSRQPEDVLDEINRLAENGYKEVVLTGIHLSSYGKDIEGTSLIDIIEDISKIDGIKRIRLGSLEPNIITEEFVTRLSKVEKICPHFHLSLQSGSDSVLKRMNRHYTSLEYLDKCTLLRKYFEHPALTTDVIVGFPQESEEEFQETKEYLEKVNFYEIHLFKYSKRQGTPAAVMKGQIEEAEKTKRSHVLNSEQQPRRKAFVNYYLNKSDEILFEEKEIIDGKEYYVGLNKEYVKYAVSVDNYHGEMNKIVQVEALGFLNDEVLFAQVL